MWGINLTTNVGICRTRACTPAHAARAHARARAFARAPPRARLRGPLVRLHPPSPPVEALKPKILYIYIKKTGVLKGKGTTTARRAYRPSVILSQFWWFAESWPSLQTTRRTTTPKRKMGAPMAPYPPRLAEPGAP